MARIAVGADHAGYELKAAVAAWLAEQGHDVVDVGTSSAGERVDYPVYGARVARAVAAGEVDGGVLVCGTGLGMSMTANRFPGIRAALVYDEYTARMAAQHNHANVICLGGRVHAVDAAIRMVGIWLSTPHEARHARRLALIDELAGAPPVAGAS